MTLQLISSFNTSQNTSSFQNGYLEIDILRRGQNPFKLVYSVMNLNTISLPWTELVDTRYFILFVSLSGKLQNALKLDKLIPPLTSLINCSWQNTHKFWIRTCRQKILLCDCSLFNALLTHNSQFIIFKALLTIARGAVVVPPLNSQCTTLPHNHPSSTNFITFLPGIFIFIFFNFFHVAILAIIHKRIQPYLATDKIWN